MTIHSYTTMQTTPHLAVTGAAMDVPLPPRRNQRKLIGLAIAATIAICAIALWRIVPHGTLVPINEVRIASVESGVFLDDIAVRASVAPLTAVMLDSVESGRVEEVFVHDGAVVQQGQLLFRLSNPQRNLELLARQAEQAQQISNLSTLRTAQEASQTEHQRRLSDLQFSLEQMEKKMVRDEHLAANGFISAEALEISRDRLAQQRRMVAEEKVSNATDAQVRRDAMQQMENAIKGLQSGLQLVRANVDALAVRAPIAGRLTDFHLQVGETVRPDQHIGRVDDPLHFKLTAQVDEFYISRIAVGRTGSARIGGQLFPVEVRTIYPQIKDGRFTVEMVFSGTPPATLSPGQSLDAQITLGQPSKALLLPNDAFVNDTGGAWVFVIGSDGESVSRRDITTGRRSNRQIEVLTGLTAGERVIISTYAPYNKSTRLQLTK
jgi:HlyD family secretion protein